MAIIIPSSGQSSSAVSGQSTQFLRYNVLQQCAGAPDTLVDTVLQNVLRDFYFMSTGWREVLGPYFIPALQDSIALNPVDQYSSVLVALEAWLYPSMVGGNSRKNLRPLSRRAIGNQTGQPDTFWLAQ